MNNPWLKRIVSTLVAVLLLVYIGYQIYNANYSSVRTEIALGVTEAETLQADGIAVRREQPLEWSGTGVLAFTLPDGGKVGMGSTLAQIYASEEDAAAQQQMETLNTQIEKLEKLSQPGSTYAADQSALSKQLNTSMSDMLHLITQNDLRSLTGAREEVLYLLNEQQVVTQKATNFSARLADLKAQRDALTASGKQQGSVTAPSGGYFISKVDGWESVFDFDSLLTLTADELKQKLAAAPAPTNAIGKIAQDYDWYFAVVLPAEDAIRLKDAVKLNSTLVYLSFPSVSDNQVPATVAAINQPNKDGEAAVFFCCDRMDSELANLRVSSAKIQIASHEGIRVSRKAIHFETISKTVKDADGNAGTVTEEVMGIYVRHGNEIDFRQVVPLYQNSNYVICSASPDADTLMTKQTVQLYDEIIVEGTDLYDGKVIQ